MKRQRDQAQSTLANANRRILELTEEVRDLQQKLEGLSAPADPARPLMPLPPFDR
jgi:hypothetical protein